MSGERLSVVAGVKRDLAELEQRQPDASQSALAALALSLAKTIDATRTSPTARAANGRVLLDTLEVLWAQAPDGAEESELERRRRDREQRLAGLSKARPASPA